MSEWVSDTFAYPNPNNKLVSTLRVSTSLKMKRGKQLRHIRYKQSLRLQDDIRSEVPECEVFCSARKKVNEKCVTVKIST